MSVQRFFQPYFALPRLFVVDIPNMSSGHRQALTVLRPNERPGMGRFRRWREHAVRRLRVDLIHEAHRGLDLLWFDKRLEWIASNVVHGLWRVNVCGYYTDPALTYVFLFTDQRDAMYFALRWKGE